MNGLFSWQEKFAPYFGKEVFLYIARSHDVMKTRCRLLDPRKTTHPYRLPRYRSVAVINSGSGKLRLISMDRIVGIKEAE